MILMYRAKKGDTARECELELDHGSDGCYLASGVYVDDGSEIPDHILDELQSDHADVLDEATRDRAIMRAECMYEGDR